MIDSHLAEGEAIKYQWSSVRFIMQRTGKQLLCSLPTCQRHINYLKTNTSAIPRGDFQRVMVPKVWSPDLQYQLHLELNGNARAWAPPQTY